MGRISRVVRNVVVTFGAFVVAVGVLNSTGWAADEVDLHVEQLGKQLREPGRDLAQRQRIATGLAEGPPGGAGAGGGAVRGAAAPRLRPPAPRGAARAARPDRRGPGGAGGRAEGRPAPAGAGHARGADRDRPGTAPVRRGVEG